MRLPIRSIDAQAIEVEIRERVFGAAKISQGTVKNRAGAREVLARLAMKSNGQLNQALKMPAQQAGARRFAPSVFEGLVGIENTPGVKAGYTAPEWPSNRKIQATKTLQRLPPDSSLQEADRRFCWLNKGFHDG